MRRSHYALAAALVLPAFGAGAALAAQPNFTIYAFENPQGEFGFPASPAQDGFAKGTLAFVASDGRLYGTTAAGGNPTGCGTVLSIAPDGSDIASLFRFSGPDGCSPRRDAPSFSTTDDRMLYGATQGHSDRTKWSTTRADLALGPATASRQLRRTNSRERR